VVRVSEITNSHAGSQKHAETVANNDLTTLLHFVWRNNCHAIPEMPGSANMTQISGLARQEFSGLLDPASGLIPSPGPIKALRHDWIHSDGLHRWSETCVIVGEDLTDEIRMVVACWWLKELRRGGLL
jgi:hypothetical protein